MAGSPPPRRPPAQAGSSRLAATEQKLLAAAWHKCVRPRPKASCRVTAEWHCIADYDHRRLGDTGALQTAFPNISMSLHHLLSLACSRRIARVEHACLNNFDKE